MLIKYVIAFTLLCKVSSNVVLKEEGNYETSKTIFRSLKEEEYIDWRERGAVSPVRDQKRCEVCWAFSIIATIESHLKIFKNSEISLSSQFLLDCDPRKLGCNTSGSLLETYSNIVNVLQGIPLESDYYEYDGKYYGCRCDNTQSLKHNKEKAEKASKDVKNPGSKQLSLKHSDDLSYYNPDGFKWPWNNYYRKGMPCPAKILVTGYKRVEPNEGVMLKYLINRGPLTAGINSKAMAEYKGNPKNRYIDEPSDEKCPPTELDHAVEIVGFNIYISKDQKVYYWIIKNSWGKDWGDDGFYYLVAGRNACGISRDVSIPYVN